jgi:hypothetical protein
MSIPGWYGVHSVGLLLLLLQQGLYLLGRISEGGAYSRWHCRHQHQDMSEVYLRQMCLPKPRSALPPPAFNTQSLLLLSPAASRHYHSWRSTWCAAVTCCTTMATPTTCGPGPALSSHLPTGPPLRSAARCGAHAWRHSR